jgi:hypothetical protein
MQDSGCETANLRDSPFDCERTKKRESKDLPKISGGVLEEATPDPIPNSEVKLLGADGTAREAVWESRTLPGLFPKEPVLTRRLFFFVSEVSGVVPRALP